MEHTIHSYPAALNRRTRTHNYYDVNYPIQVWYLTVCFLFVVGVFQHGSWLLDRCARRQGPHPKHDAEAGVAPSTGRISLRRLPQAIASVYRVAAFRWTISFGGRYTLNLAEVFVTCVYTIALFTWTFVHTNDLSISSWGQRAAAVAAAQLPLVTVLGTKNNVVSYITRIPHERLVYVHRMTSRVVFVGLWVHAGAKLHTGKATSYEADFRRLGLVAIFSFTILILVSIRPIRAASYELFFVIHSLMCLIFLLGAYFHAVQRDAGMYVWPCFLIWGLDRAIRVVRTLLYNHGYFDFSSSKKDALDATAERLSPHFVRLRLARPPHFHWSAGQTAYLTMPGVSALPWEAHPFTILSIDVPDDVGRSVEKNEGIGEKDSASATDESADAPMWKELVFLIGVRDGVTKRLASAAEKGEKVRVLVDGPYGFSPDFSGDDTAILVAGSSGISYNLAMFLSIVESARNETSKCRKVVFIWSIRDAAHVEWVSNTLSQALAIAPAHLHIAIRIYVTAGAPPPASNADADAWEDDSVHSRSGAAEEKSRPPSLLGSPAVEVLRGRADLQTLLRAEAAANTGRMSVTVCGSYGIAHACRVALRFPAASPVHVLQGGANVVMHIESFGYA